MEIYQIVKVLLRCYLIYYKEVILSNCQIKTNKKDAKTQNKIKNMQKCKTNLKKTKQYKTNYKQIQYKILKIEKRSKTIKKK